MNAADQRHWTPRWLVLTVLLGAAWLVLLAGWGRNVHWDAPIAVSTAAPKAPVVSLPQAQPLDDFAVVWRRPLFDPERKPVANSATGGSIGELTLTGVIITPTLRMALLHDRHDDRELRLRNGEALPDGGPILVEVKPRSAVFDTSNGRVELQLPAGAPIDEQRAPADSNTPDTPNRPAPGNPEAPRLIPPPSASPGNVPLTPAAHAQRIREIRATIQQRRAAQAVTAHEGER